MITNCAFVSEYVELKQHLHLIFSLNVIPFLNPLASGIRLGHDWSNTVVTLHVQCYKFSQNFNYHCHDFPSNVNVETAGTMAAHSAQAHTKETNARKKIITMNIFELFQLTLTNEKTLYWHTATKRKLSLIYLHLKIAYCVRKHYEPLFTNPEQIEPIKNLTNQMNLKQFINGGVDFRMMTLIWAAAAAPPKCDPIHLLCTIYFISFSTEIVIMFERCSQLRNDATLNHGKCNFCIDFVWSHVSTLCRRRRQWVCTTNAFASEQFSKYRRLFQSIFSKHINLSFTQKCLSWHSTVATHASALVGAKYRL